MYIPGWGEACHIVCSPHVQTMMTEPDGESNQWSVARSLNLKVDHRILKQDCLEVYEEYPTSCSSQKLFPSKSQLAWRF